MFYPSFTIFIWNKQKKKHRSKFFDNFEKSRPILFDTKKNVKYVIFSRAWIHYDVPFKFPLFFLQISWFSFYFKLCLIKKITLNKEYDFAKSWNFYFGILFHYCSMYLGSCFSTSCSSIAKYRPNTVWIHNGKDGGHHQLSHRAKNGKFCTINYSRKACSHKNENPQQRSTASEHTILYYDPFVNTKGFFFTRPKIMAFMPIWSYYVVLISWVVFQCS